MGLSGRLAELTVGPGMQPSPQFRTMLLQAEEDPVRFLRSLCQVKDGDEGSKALSLLVGLLGAKSRPWPVLDLLRCYGALSDRLPEAAKAGRDHQATSDLRAAVNLIHDNHGSLANLIPDSDRPALLSPDGHHRVSLKALRRAVGNFKLPLPKTRGGANPVVAIAIPNSSLLASTCLAVATYFAAAPINPTVGADQFRSDAEQVRASCIVTTPEMAEKLELGAWTTRANVAVYFVDFHESDGLRITDVRGQPLVADDGIEAQPNKAFDTCILLFTSGTSGTKKVVPLSLHLIVYGAVLVIDGWALTASDVCLNMMPLFHM
jgi:hypothetical protein